MSYYIILVEAVSYKFYLDSEKKKKALLYKIAAKSPLVEPDGACCGP